MEDQTLEDRLRAVERAVSDDTNPTPPTHTDDRLDDIETRLQDLEAATQALRGYVGDVRSTTDRPHPDTDTTLADLQHTTHTTPIPDTKPPDTPTHDKPDDDTLLDRIDEWL